MSIIPTFLESSFRFDGEAPRHIEERPSVPTYAGAYAIFGATAGNKPYALAYDVPNEAMARLLAEARKQHQEESIEVYGYSDDVYILYPNQDMERTYYGRSAED